MSIIDQLKHKLIVSCQAEAGFPLNTPDHLVALAQTVVMGGASAIRASEPANIRAMRQVLDVPIIGIYKKDTPGYEVRITPTLAEVEAIVAAGSHIVALDATHRPRPDGQTFAELYRAIRSRYDIPIMADISTLDEGIKAAELGVDIVATTLSGYTDYSPAHSGPDTRLIRELAAATRVPIIAEGRIRSPGDVRAALDAGAFAVVVGSMITRPHLITQHFLTGLQPPRTPQTVLALDIGGTKIAAAVVDAQGQILRDGQVPTPAGGGGPAIVEQAVALLRSLQATFDGAPPEAIGISTGGQIDATGHIIGSTGMIPDWVDFPLKERIGERYGLPTAVLNDGHAAALAESRFGVGRGRSSMLCVVIGTGLGGGLVVNERVQHGARGLAGSVGQMKVSTNDQAEVALEKLVSGPGLLGLYNGRVAAEVAAVDGREVAQRAQDGEAAAQQAIGEIGAWLGLGLSHALHAYDAECVAVGGSVAQIGALLLDAARRSLRQHGHSTVANTPILPAQLGTHAGLVGAAVFAQQQIAKEMS